MKTKSNMTVKDKMKTSELFEGKNSSLKKAFDKCCEQKPKELEWEQFLIAMGWDEPDYGFTAEKENVQSLLTQQRTELLGDVSLIVRGCWVQVQSPTGDFDVIDPEKLNKELFNLLNKKDDK